MGQRSVQEAGGKRPWRQSINGTTVSSRVRWQASKLRTGDGPVHPDPAGPAATIRLPDPARCDGSEVRLGVGSILVEVIPIPKTRNPREFRMSSVTRVGATLDDLYRVEGKAELINGTIVHFTRCAGR
jgi:hypothetical protein